MVLRDYIDGGSLQILVNVCQIKYGDYDRDAGGIRGRQIPSKRVRGNKACIMILSVRRGIEVWHGEICRGIIRALNPYDSGCAGRGGLWRRDDPVEGRLMNPNTSTPSGPLI